MLLGVFFAFWLAPSAAQTTMQPASTPATSMESSQAPTGTSFAILRATIQSQSSLMNRDIKLLLEKLSEVILQFRPDLKIHLTATYVPVVQTGGKKPLEQETPAPEPPDPEVSGSQPFLSKRPPDLTLTLWRPKRILFNKIKIN
ncbi:unnamed protein product [Boreogadus saida]